MPNNKKEIVEKLLWSLKEYYAASMFTNTGRQYRKYY